MRKRANERGSRRSFERACPGGEASPTHHRSILPPVSMHFAADDYDLQDRLKRLSTEDLKYLADLILDGSECLLCISPEAAGMFLDLLEECLAILRRG